MSAPPPLPFLCLVAGHRAGTTALRTALEGSGAFAGLGEIFQTGRPHAFPDYALAQNLPLSALFSEAQAARMIDTYLDSLQAAAARRIPLIDVKLYAWAGLRLLWGHALDEPPLMRRLKARETRFLFIQRQDLAAQILSEHIARATRKWHGLTPEDAPVPLSVPVETVLRQALAIIHSERLVWQQLADGGRVRATTYEALFDQGHLALPLQDWLTETFGLRPGPPLRPKIARNEVGAEAAVANHAEIAAAVAALSRREHRLCLWQEGPDQPIR